MSQLEKFARRGLAAQNAVDEAIRNTAPRPGRAAIYTAGFRDRPGAAPGVCRVCGCTQERACDNSCSWITNDLCSTCAEAILAVQRWMENAYRAPGARLIREAKERARR